MSSVEEPAALDRFETGVGLLSFAVLLVETVFFVYTTVLCGGDEPRSMTTNPERRARASGVGGAGGGGSGVGGPASGAPSPTPGSTLSSYYFNLAVHASIADQSPAHVAALILCWPGVAFFAWSISALGAGRRSLCALSGGGAGSGGDSGGGGAAAIAAAAGAAGCGPVWVWCGFALAVLVCGAVGCMRRVQELTRVSKRREARSFARALAKEFGANTDEESSKSSTSGNSSSDADDGAYVIDITNVEISRGMSRGVSRASNVRFGDES